MRHVLGALLFALAIGSSQASAAEDDTDTLSGPLLPNAAEESRSVVMLASAIELPTNGDQQARLQAKLIELDRLQVDIQQLRKSTGTPAQIVVRVEVLEVSLTKLKQLGIEMPPSLGGVIAAPESLESLRRSGVYAHDSEARILPLRAKGSSAELVDLLKENNIGKMLTDSRLITLSGQPASFHVGGEIPLPSAPGSQAAVEYREFGTHVEVLASPLGNKRVRLEVHQKCSELDQGHAVEIQSHRVPALRVQQCTVGYEAALDETVIIGGMSEKRIESWKSSDGRVEERDNEIATWYVIQAEQIEAARPLVR